MDLTTKTNAEMADQERADRAVRRSAIREQVVQDQATNAKRDKKALATEARWYRKNGQVK